MISKLAGPLFRSCWPCAVLITIEPLSAGIVISEIQVRNHTTLRDEDQETPDWIELCHDDEVPVSLEGWTLRKNGSVSWTFPAVTLAPRQRLVIFASGKNRTLPGAPLHTSYELSAGDALALIDRDERIVWSMPSLPSLPMDASWGIREPSLEIPLFGEGDFARWRPLETSDLAPSEVPAWVAPEFNADSWTESPVPLSSVATMPGLSIQALVSEMVINSSTDLDFARSRPGGVRETGGFGVLPQLDLKDGESDPESGRFAGGHDNPAGAAPGGSLHRLYRVRGLISIPRPGWWTIGVGSDGGVFYQGSIGEAGFSKNSFGGGPIPIDIGLPVPQGFMETRHAMELPEGLQPIEFWFTQGAESTPLEVSLAEGDKSNVPDVGLDDDFRLLGSVGESAVTTTPGEEVASLSRTVIPPPSTAATPLGFAARIGFQVPAGPPARLWLRAFHGDGLRVWLDGVPVLQTWKAPQEPSWRTPDDLLESTTYELPPVSAGSHGLSVEIRGSAKNRAVVWMHPTLVARRADGTEGNAYFSSPTPGSPNDTPAFLGITEPPQVTAGRAVVDSPTTVTILPPASSPTAAVYYTLDGSEPTEDQGQLYSEPLVLTETTVLRAAAFAPGFLPSKTISHTYLFPESQGAQSGEALPELWGQVRADYEFGPRERPSGIVPHVAPALRALPSLSITLDPEDAFGPFGLMAFSEIRGAVGERPASVEWIWPEGYSYQEEATLRIKGEASRSASFLKHGLRLDFPKRLGGPLRHPLFAESPRDRFNTVLLHGSFVDNTLTLRDKAQFIRDLWARDTLRAMGWPAPHGDYCHVYLNGLYWGLYHAGERADAEWCAATFGGQADHWDVISDDLLVDGDLSAWAEFRDWLQTAPFTPEGYLEIQSRLDVPAFIDYLLVNLYAVNTDWPGHNWYCVRPRSSEGLWRFISWDAEFSFDRVSQNLIPEIDQDLGGAPGDVFRYLRKFAPFRRLFADHVRRHFLDDGALTPAAAEARWMRRAAQIADAIPAEMARWGDVGPDAGGPIELPGWLARVTEGGPDTIDTSHWRAELARLRRDWFPQRTRVLLRQLRAVDLYPDVTPPVFSSPPPHVPRGHMIALSNRGYDGPIYFTLDGSDPSGPDGQPTTTAQRYTGPLTPAEFPAVVRIKARTWFDDEASALTEGSFSTGPNPSALHVTEIHFAPPGPGQTARSEFVELWNAGDEPLPLDGVSLEGAVRYTFPTASSIPANGRIILARDAGAFALAFPNTAPDGLFTGALADEGETLILRHHVVGILEQVPFRPHKPWPQGTDGRSLQRVAFTGQPHLPESWQAILPTPKAGTPSKLTDTDTDGIPDEWELRRQTRLTRNDALEDPDGDGYDNRLEYAADTAPHDSSSFPRFTSVELDPDTGRLLLGLVAQPGRQYTVRTASALPGPWREVGHVAAEPGNEPSETIVDVGLPVDSGYYRLDIEIER